MWPRWVYDDGAAVGRLLIESTVVCDDWSGFLELGAICKWVSASPAIALVTKSREALARQLAAVPGSLQKPLSCRGGARESRVGPSRLLEGLKRAYSAAHGGVGCSVAGNPSSLVRRSSDYRVSTKFGLSRYEEPLFSPASPPPLLLSHSSKEVTWGVSPPLRVVRQAWSRLRETQRSVAAVH